MQSNKLKLLIITFLVLPLVGLMMFNAKPLGILTPVNANDAAATYKTKCAMCHGQKAEKKFDLEMSDEDMVQAILKGKKAEKPPRMPEYESKGIDEEQAKALVAFMRELRKPAE
jgi:mono/diheme cytochrome c family protein